MTVQKVINRVLSVLKSIEGREGVRRAVAKSRVAKALSGVAKSSNLRGIDLAQAKMAVFTNSDVRKELTDEEMTLISNIEALFAELKGMVGSGAVMPDDEVEMGDEMGDEMAMEYEDDMEIEKAIENGDADEPVANDDAEERVGDLPEADQENTDEVRKMISAMARKLGVQKAQGPDSETRKVLKALVDQQAQQSAVLAEILEGLGVVGQMPERVEKSKKKPAQSTDMEQFAEVLKSLVEQKNGNAPSGRADRSDVRKDLGSFLQGFAANNQWS